nr:protein yipf4 [Hymenolepis microstoma]
MLSTPSNKELPHTTVDLSFVSPSPSSGSDAYTSSLTGNIDGYKKGSDGLFQSALRKRGFGWMLEVETEDADFDKPILEALDIDLKTIGKKMKAVILPCVRSGLDPASIRENPDFWGPLAVIMMFSLVSLFGQLRVVAWILMIWLAGSFIIYFITRSLGGDVAYAQCLGVIGYCLLPLFLTCTLGSLFNLGGFHRFSLLVSFVGTLWSAYSAGKLLSMENLQHRCSLVVYPVCLLIMLDEEEIDLDVLVELFYTWLLDNKAHALTICTLPELASMFCEERNTKLTDEFMTQFQISTYRFFDKLSRVKPMPRLMKVVSPSNPKTQNGLQEHAGNNRSNGDVEMKGTSITNGNQSNNSSIIDLMSNEDPDENDVDRFDDCDLSPPLIKTPISNARRKNSMTQEPYAMTFFSPKFDPLK